MWYKKFKTFHFDDRFQTQSKQNLVECAIFQCLLPDRTIDHIRQLNLFSNDHIRELIPDPEFWGNFHVFFILLNCCC